MFSWLKNNLWKQEAYADVIEELKDIYKNKLLPLEKHHNFHDFHATQLEDSDFDAKPTILLVGQYSTGKTTFIKYLLERDFPGMRIGPEPTTDRFIAIMYGEKEGIIPGNTLVVDPKRQFKPLSKFGNTFLNRFQCSLVNSTILRNISIIDTPGILSGEKQRVDRGYDFTGVLEWFAERVDRIILLFDAHKLDISDEFRRSIEALRGHDDKIRIVLNKADMMDQQELMRVYGALMWSLSKVLGTSEVARVYIGSFWDRPLHNDTNAKLLECEEMDLFRDLESVSRNATIRKLNDLLKRARMAKAHAYILAELYKRMPLLFGIESKRRELIINLRGIYYWIQQEYGICSGDFPEIIKMQEILKNKDFLKFSPLDPKLLAAVDRMLLTDISNLMARISFEKRKEANEPNEVPSEENIQKTNEDQDEAHRDNTDTRNGEHEMINPMTAKIFEIFFQTQEATGECSSAFWDQLFQKLIENEIQNSCKESQSHSESSSLEKLKKKIISNCLKKCHVYITAELSKNTLSCEEKESKRKEFIKILEVVYDTIHKKYHITPLDFPEMEEMQKTLANLDFTESSPLKPIPMETVDKAEADNLINAGPPNCNDSPDGADNTIFSIRYRKGLSNHVAAGVSKDEAQSDRLFNTSSSINRTMNGRDSGEAANISPHSLNTKLQNKRKTLANLQSPVECPSETATKSMTRIHPSKTSFTDAYKYRNSRLETYVNIFLLIICVYIFIFYIL